MYFTTRTIFPRFVTVIVHVSYSIVNGLENHNGSSNYCMYYINFSPLDRKYHISLELFGRISFINIRLFYF